ncbi:MAG TPA: hypothetical protein VGW34_03920 [Allosphingosinicella sp.]|nr:hypothetical protein [Allosphingosinicella sp.]
MSLDGIIAGWELRAHAEWTSGAGEAPPLRRSFGRGPGGGALRASGLSDLDFSAVRSFDVSRRLSFDFGTSVSLPTGSVRGGLGTGRVEAVVDGGFSTRVRKWQLWAGAARRLRGSSELYSERDVWEIYAGVHGWVGRRSSLRVELERRQAPWPGAAPEVSARLSLRRKLARGISLHLTAARENDEFSEERVASIALRWQLQPH